MNSSGIKRGLAVSAVSALAVAGIPALANTASAAAGDEIVFVSAGPTLNHGAVGGEIHVKLKGVTEAELDAHLDAFNTALTGSPNSPAQTVTITDTSYEYVANGATGDSNPTDGYAEATVLVAVDTPANGDTANYALVVNDNDDANVDATEARTQVAQQTSGPLSKIEVAPTTQSSPQNVESGDYTVTLKDAAGRTTQLDTGEVVDLTPNSGTVTLSDNQFDEFELIDGAEAFTATGTTVGTYTIAIASPDYTGEQTSAEFKVTQAAVLGAANIDIVTAADSWNGFGDGTDGGTTLVRVDQNTIRFDFDAADSQAGANVRLAVDGTGVTFAGQDKAVYSTTLDASGNGSITVTVDAATIQDTDTFSVDINGFTQTIDFDRAHAASIDGESATYFCQDNAACTVTAVVLDQFGNPVTTGEVEAKRTGTQNVDTTPQRKAVNSDGTVDFTFTDANPVNGGTDTVQFQYFLDQFDNTAELTDNSTTIKYSATGQGSNYAISLDGENTEGATYDAGDAAIIPLTDTLVDEDGIGDDGDEDAVIGITGGEANQAVTLSVDNGALILAPGEDQLSEGSASVETTLDGGGALPAGYRVIGTKSGLVTLTVGSAGRTETAPLTVLAQDNTDAARNVTVSGPAEVEHGTPDITYTAVITDAFGNPVSGVGVWQLNIQVSGPGQFKDSDAMTDANGQIHLNVSVDPDAVGDITIRVQGMYSQFGAAADRVYASSNTKDGAGLPASSSVATATTTVKGEVVPPPVEKVSAALTLRGGDNGAADDSLFANAINKTAGAEVTLFKRRADGSWKVVAEALMNSKGNHRFKNVPDRNGDKVTRYKAVVKATSLTKRGVGKKKVR